MKRTPKVVERLRDAEVAVRLQAAREIAEEACKETTPQGEAFFHAPGLMEAIVNALDDPEPEVAENAVIALAEGARRYVEDADGYPGVARLLHSPRAQARAWAIRAAVTLGGGESVNDLLALAGDRAAAVRSAVLVALGDLAVSGLLHPSDHPRVAEAALAALEDSDARVRDNAADALREVGGPGCLAALKAARRKETDRLTQEGLDQAIEAVRARG